jgi:hypothetical protein
MYKTLLVASAIVAVQGVKMTQDTTQLPAEDQAAKIANTQPDQDIDEAKGDKLVEGQVRVQEQQDAINDSQIKNDVASNKMKAGEVEAEKKMQAEKEARESFVSMPLNREVVAEVPDLDAINPQGAVEDDMAEAVLEVDTEAA